MSVHNARKVLQICKSSNPCLGFPLRLGGISEHFHRAWADINLKLKQINYTLLSCQSRGFVNPCQTVLISTTKLLRKMLTKGFWFHHWWKMTWIMCVISIDFKIVYTIYIYVYMYSIYYIYVHLNKNVVVKLFYFQLICIFWALVSHFPLESTIMRTNNRFNELGQPTDHLRQPL